MHLSLTNASITLQRYIKKALGILVDTIYIVYLDNNFVYLNNKDKYIKYMKQILQQLRAQGLYAKLLKYIFYTKNIKFLGFIIIPNCIIIDLTRVKVINNNLSLSSIGVFRSFLASPISISSLSRTTRILYILYRRIIT